MEVAPAVFREVGGDRTIAFIENGDGQVVGMVGQFAFIPFYKLRWYEGSPFQFTLLGLSLLLFLIAMVSALRNWKSDKTGPTPARWARRNLGLLGALNLVFVVAFVSIFAAGLSELDLRPAQGPLRRADLAARRAGAHRHGRDPGRAGVAREVLDARRRACFTPRASWRLSPSSGS